MFNEFVFPFFSAIGFMFCIETQQCLSFVRHLGLGSTLQVAPLQPLDIGSFSFVTRAFLLKALSIKSQSQNKQYQTMAKKLANCV